MARRLLPRRRQPTNLQVRRENDPKMKSRDVSSQVILVVDDEPLVAELAVETLLHAGYLVTFALDAASALKILQENTEIELLFADVVMPGTDGFKLAAQAAKLRPGLKVLYASGHVDLARQLIAVGEAPGQILEKPYRPSELVIAVRTTLAVPDK